MVSLRSTTGYGRGWLRHSRCREWVVNTGTDSESDGAELVNEGTDMNAKWITATTILALGLGALAPEVRAGDREWAVAGKVLTGLAAASVVARVLDPAPCATTTAVVYQQPAVYVAPQPVVYAAPVVAPAPVAPPAPVYVAPAPAPVYYAPAPVVYAAPVYVAPAPVYVAPAPVYLPAPVFVHGYRHHPGFRGHVTFRW